MTYRLSKNLFLENGPTNAAERTRARRAIIDAYMAVEQARLTAARTVTGGDFRNAA